MQNSESNLWSLLKPYAKYVALLILLTVLCNGLNLVVPQLISQAIDSYEKGGFVLNSLIIPFLVVAILIFVFNYLQNIVQTVTAEKVARDLRNQLTDKISKQDYNFIQNADPAKLLTYLTSDVDGVKTFVAQAISSIISSVFLIIGASVLLLFLNWQLAFAILLVVPVFAFGFLFFFRKIRKLFKKGQESIDWLNKVINESIMGSALVRIVNSQMDEYNKFLAANTVSKDIGLSILKLFACVIPLVTFITNFATLLILVLGGHYVIIGNMTLGNFSAFNSYLSILIFPILIISFMSNVIAQATASYQRISDVLNAPDVKQVGHLKAHLSGEIDVDGISLSFGEKLALNDVSFKIKPGSKTAIIGPTAAGKTQLLYLMLGLIKPTSGTIHYDKILLEEYDMHLLHKQIGFVFQDSSIFNLSLRENISFSSTVKDADLKKAIETAELTDYINDLPEKLDTVVSERGASLSGGQKQRIMLARALALNPRVLLLDDFTARVDIKTEQKILNNIEKNYPELTLISVTQKIESIKDYDQIILLMEGEVLAKGTHNELIKKSPEYIQIFNSQKSTNNYELLSK